MYEVDIEEDVEHAVSESVICDMERERDHRKCMCLYSTVHASTRVRPIRFLLYSYSYCTFVA